MSIDQLKSIPQSLSRADFLKYLNIIIALLSKLQNTNKEELSGLEQKLEEGKAELLEIIKTIELTPGPQGPPGESIVGPPGKDGLTPIPGIDYDFPKDGKDGLNGKDGKDADEVIIVQKVSEQVIEVLKGLIPTVEAIELDLPKLGSQIRDGLELLQGDDRLKIEAIKDLREELDKIKDAKISVVGGGGKYAYQIFNTPAGNISSTTVQDALNELDTEKVSLVELASNTAGDAGCDLVGIPTIGTPTFTRQCDFNKMFGSAGRATGGSITDAGGETINVAAGTGFIKATDSDTAEILSFNWVASAGLSVPTNTVRYVGVEYNAGSPQIVVKTTQDWDYDTEFPLGSVANQAGTLYIMNDYWWVTDGITNIIERFQSEGTVRDNHIGGLIIGTSGTNTTRKPTLTAGTVWSRLNEFNITAKDCSGTDTFYGFYRDGAGGWTRTVAKTDIDDFYDNNSGTLQALGTNKFVNFWIFAEIDNPNNGQLMVIYPQTQYNTSATAENEDVPVFPSIWYKHGILLGKIMVKQGVTAPIEVASSFSTMFTAALAADHGNLSGLLDDDHTQYLRTDGTRQLTGNWSVGNAYLQIANGYGLFASTGLNTNNFLLYGDKTETDRDIRGKDFVNTRSATINRDLSGFITSIAKTGGRTITYTRDLSNFVTSKTDGTNTWTYTRNLLNQVTAVTVT